MGEAQTGVLRFTIEIVVYKWLPMGFKAKLIIIIIGCSLFKMVTIDYRRINY